MYVNMFLVVLHNCLMGSIFIKPKVHWIQRGYVGYENLWD